MAALTDEEAREAVRLLATAHAVLLGDPPKNAEGQPAWWTQYGAHQLLGLRDIAEAYVQFHQWRAEDEQEPPAE
jgi:hypothetical protein